MNIFDAIKNGDMNEVTNLLNADKNLANKPNDTLSFVVDNITIKSPTPLYAAIYYSSKQQNKEKYYHIIETLLKNGSDCNHVPAMAEGVTALELAMIIDDKEIISKLIKNGAQVNAKISSGATILHIAVYEKNMALLQLLKSLDVDFNACNLQDSLLLHLAISVNASPELISLLIERGIDINITDEFGTTALFRAITEGDVKGNIEGIKVLLQNQANLSIPTHPDAKSLLHYAVLKDMPPEIIELLIKAGANPNEVDNSGLTPLHLTKNTAVAQTLIKCRANINQPINSVNPSPEFILFLLDSGIEINISDDYGTAALYRALKEGNVKVIKLLLEHQPSFKIAYSPGIKNLLHHAVSNDISPEIIELLIKAGASPNERDNNNLTPLHLTTNAAVAKILINSGANVNDVSDRGSTPLHLLRNNTAVAEVLLDNGADINLPDKFGRTPFTRAVNKGEIDTIKLFYQKRKGVISVNMRATSKSLAGL